MKLMKSMKGNALQVRQDRFPRWVLASPLGGIGHLKCHPFMTFPIFMVSTGISRPAHGGIFQSWLTSMLNASSKFGEIVPVTSRLFAC